MVGAAVRTAGATQLPPCGNIPPTTHAAEVLLQWRSEHLLPLGRYDNPLLMARPRFAALVVG
jgi:hypothetical protein